MADNLLSPQYQTGEAKVAQDLPAEVQYGLNRAMLQQALAQAMLQRGMQMPEGQTIVTGAGAPNRYVRPNITQNLGQMANMVLGARGLGGALGQQANVMAGYQGQEKSAIDAALAKLGIGSIPAGQAGPSPERGPITSNQLLEAAQGLNPNFPLQRIEQEKLRQAAVGKAQTESEVAGKLAEAGIKNAPAASQAATATTALQTALPGAAAVQPPGTPPVSIDPKTGLAMTTNAQTNAPVAISQDPFETRVRQQGLQTAHQNYNSSLADAQKDFPDAKQSGVIAAQADMALKLLDSGKALTGPMALDLAHIGTMGQILGHPVGSTVVPTQLLQNLSLSLFGQGKVQAGMQGRITNVDVKLLGDAGGGNLEFSNPALRAVFEKLRSNALADLQTHNIRAQQVVDMAGDLNVPTNAAQRNIVQPQFIPDFTGLVPGQPSGPQVQTQAAASGSKSMFQPRRVYSDGTPVPAGQ